MVVRERTVIVAVVISLVLGIGLYNGFDWKHGSLQATVAASVGTPATPAAVDGAATGSSAPAANTIGSGVDSTAGGLFGSGVAALQGGTDASAAGAGGSTIDVPDAPDTPDTPPTTVPACPTSVANDAYESIVDPVSAAIGQPLPRDNVRVLAEIAAGCSNDTPTTPVVGLALDLARLVPSTGLAPVDLSAVPVVDAPTIPPAVIAALAPVAGPIQDGCGDIGLLSVVAAVIPGAAHIPVYGSDLSKVLVPAQTLCAQFEG